MKLRTMSLDKYINPLTNIKSEEIYVTTFIYYLQFP